MRALLSIKLWLVFFGYFFKVLFPPMWVAAAFIWFGRKKITRNSAFYFIMLFAAITLAGRLFILFAGVAYQYRYLYIPVILLLAFCGLGMVEFAAFLAKWRPRILPKLQWLDGKKLFLFTIILISCVNIPKALKPRFDKKWIRTIPQTVLTHTPQGKKPILISALDEYRLGFYSKATFMKLKKVDNLLTKATISVAGNDLADTKQNIAVDGSLKVNKELRNGQAININFKKKIRYRIAYLDFYNIALPEGSIKIMGRKSTDVPFKMLYDGPLKPCIKVFRVKHLKEMKLLFTLPKNRLLPLKNLCFSRYLLWEIRQKGSGINCENWMPICRKPCTAKLNQMLKNLGNQNVFMLLKGKDTDWQPIFKQLKCKVKAVKQFDKVKKKTYTLYQLL